jgi:hypothetical protein
LFFVSYTRPLYNGEEKEEVLSGMDWEGLSGEELAGQLRALRNQFLHNMQEEGGS